MDEIRWSCSLLDDMAEKRTFAMEIIDRVDPKDYRTSDIETLSRMWPMLEFAVIRCIPFTGTPEDSNIRDCALDAAKIISTLPHPEDPIELGKKLLRMVCLFSIGGRKDLILKKIRKIPSFPIESKDWGIRLWSTVLDSWLRLLIEADPDRKRLVENRVLGIVEDQKRYENGYLDAIERDKKRCCAIELISLYHLATAAKKLAIGQSDSVDIQLKYAEKASFKGLSARMIDLGPLTCLLRETVADMVVQ